MKTTHTILDLLAEMRFDVSYILPGKRQSQSLEAIQLLAENDRFPIGKRPLTATQRALLQDFLTVHRAAELLERRNREETPLCTLDGVVGAFRA